MTPWSLQNSQNWLIFSNVEKNWQKEICFLCRATPTPWATHKNSEKNDQNIMYPPGTWIWRNIKIPCTRVHGFEEKAKYHVPGYMDLKKKQNSMYRDTWIWKNIFLCVAQVRGWRWTGAIFCFFWQFFSTCEKIIQFLEFCKYQGGKI